MTTMLLVLQWLIVVAATFPKAGGMNQFLPPEVGSAAVGADLSPPMYTDGAEACAKLCLTYSGPSFSGKGCISFNLCSTGTPNKLLCGVQGWNRTYAVAQQAGCSLYHRILPRNDSAVRQAIRWKLSVPIAGVVLHGGLLLSLFENNVEYLLQNFAADDLLFPFRARAGLPQAPGAKCHGWDCRSDWVEGSVSGLFLMGAGNALLWLEHPELRKRLNHVVDGVANCSQPNGFIMAFNESKLANDEHPDYTLSWMVHGLLAADAAGNPKALQLARGMMDLFNNHTLLRTFLPPDGGNWPYQSPAGPPPPGFDNLTCGGLGAQSGHTIYLISQGLIHNTRMALSRLGKQADVDLVRELYEEPWYLDFLAAGNPEAIWKRQWFAHNYLLTAWEAYLDMYVLTGTQMYLDAILSAWGMWRRQFMHVGGSVAVSEVHYYPPGSYYLTGQQAQPSRAHVREQREALGDQGNQGNQGVCGEVKYPTGEFCGAVFWLKLNQRFHRLFPDNETFVLEMEKELFNEGWAHQANTSGIRYNSNLHKKKEDPGSIGTCCEGQGTRLYGSINEYLFSLAEAPLPDGLYVDMYSPSSIAFTTRSGVQVNVSVLTAWPYGEAVEVLVQPTSDVVFDLSLRMPAWAAGDGIPVRVSSRSLTWTPVGQPGSYLKLTSFTFLASGTSITFSLPMAFTAHLYTGFTQVLGYRRFAYTYGPLLLAATGSWNSTADAITINSAATGVDPVAPDSWMQPLGDGNALHFQVRGIPGLLFVPFGEIGEEQFSTYPAFVGRTTAEWPEAFV